MALAAAAAFPCLGGGSPAWIDVPEGSKSAFMELKRRKVHRYVPEGSKSAFMELKSALISWSTDDSHIHAKTIYAVSRNQFRHELNGVQ